MERIPPREAGQDDVNFRQMPGMHNHADGVRVVAAFQADRSALRAASWAVQAASAAVLCCLCDAGAVHPK